MEERILKFIAALRAGGARVSLAESADAFNAVNRLGIQDRDTFRLSLRSTLVKDSQHLPTFDELFPLFFNTTNTAPLFNLATDLNSQEAQEIAETLQHLSKYFQEMLEKLIQGEPLSQDELDHAAQFVGMRHANDLRYQEWMARRMEQAMQFTEIRESIQHLLAVMAQLQSDPRRAPQLQQALAENLSSWQDQIRQYVGHQIAENITETPTGETPDRLMDRPFTALSEKDMQVLRQQVKRLAAALRSRAALRQKRAKNGNLDPKATIRANLKHFGVPIEIIRRHRHLKPKLVVFCDVSTSMRYCSELMLSLIYALKDNIRKTHAFAFIDHLEYINPDFSGSRAEDAVRSVLARIPPGYYSTNLGSSLDDFSRDYLDTLDGKTSFIMVGDARNNYNPPRLEIFKQLAGRSYRTLWINPEPQSQWGTGDSDMPRYAPYCDDILHAATLNQLAAAVDRLLTG